MRLQVDDRYDGFVDEIVRDGEWGDEREDGGAVCAHQFEFKKIT